MPTSLISTGARFPDHSIRTVARHNRYRDKAIFGYGVQSFGNTNLVSNTGSVSTDVACVGTVKSELAAASYGGDKAIFAFGIQEFQLPGAAVTNLVSNTGVAAADVTTVTTTRLMLAAAGYGGDKAIFGYGYTGTPPNYVPYQSMTNLVSNTGVVAANVGGVGTARSHLAAAGYGGDKAIFGYGYIGGFAIMWNTVTNTGVVNADVSGVGTHTYGMAAAGYGDDKAIFSYGYNGGALGFTFLISNTGAFVNMISGVGTLRYYLAAAGYGGDKAIFGYGNAGANSPYGVQNITNLVSNTGVVTGDVTGVGTAKYMLAAAGYGS